MKLFDKKSLIFLISVVSINLLCVISVSYAYFTAKINSNAQEMKVISGTMAITYTDSNKISLNNALPGDSVTKQFKIENTGTLDTKYNIKLKVKENTFIDKKDLEITLKRNNKADTINIVPAMGEGYILINENINTKEIHTYNLILKFKNDLEDTNQNDNANKKVDFTIEVDSNTNAKIYEYSYSKDNTFYSKLKEAELSNNAAYDDFGNIRYIGKEPNNYIWFNCDSYEGLNQTTASQKCEKWRIIGDFKDTLKSDETREDLIKIIRADSIGDMQYDSSTNSWENATLQKSLTNYYNGQDLGSGKGITSTTKDMIEQITWNIGGWNSSEVLTKQIYEYERGSLTQNGTPSTWNGYIALIYPSDYGYATGGGTTRRKECLSFTLWTSYRENNCPTDNWLVPTTADRMLTPNTGASESSFHSDPIGDIYTNSKSKYYGVRPALYLKSNVKIVSGNGSSTEPYILIP